MSLSRRKRQFMGWRGYGWCGVNVNPKLKRFFNKRERRWLKQQLKKEAEE